MFSANQVGFFLLNRELLFGIILKISKNHEKFVEKVDFYSSISPPGSGFGFRIRIRIQPGNLNPDPPGSGFETLDRKWWAKFSESGLNVGTLPNTLYLECYGTFFGKKVPVAERSFSAVLWLWVIMRFFWRTNYPHSFKVAKFSEPCLIF